MREITVNGQVYPLVFGMDFLRELNKRRGVQMQGSDKVVGGLLTTITFVETMGDLEALLDLVEAGLVTEKKRPDKKSLEEWLFALEDVEGTVTDFLQQLQMIPALKFMIAKGKQVALNEQTAAFLNQQ